MFYEALMWVWRLTMSRKESLISFIRLKLSGPAITFLFLFFLFVRVRFSAKGLRACTGESTGSSSGSKASQTTA